jgi:hypothetical protein
VLEREVQNAVLAGRVCVSQSGGYVFDPERRWVAQVERRPGRLRERPRAWLVTEVLPYVEETRDAGKATSRPVPKRKEESNGDR